MISHETQVKVEVEQIKQDTKVEENKGQMKKEEPKKKSQPVEKSLTQNKPKNKEE